MSSDERDVQLKLLRDQVARLVSRNLELQSRIEELEREKSELAVEPVVAALIRAIHTAETAIAAEAPEGRRYIIPQLQATLRGFLTRREDGLSLRLPRPEHPAPPDHLASIALTVAQVPPLEPTDSTRDLVEALESAQAAFGAWGRQPGAALAGDLTARLTHLLATREEWGGDEFVRAVHSLAEAAVKLGEIRTRRLPADMRNAYRAAAKHLLDVAVPLRKAGQAGGDDFARLSEAVAQLTRHLPSVVKRSS